jgi:hypothetical protein
MFLEVAAFFGPQRVDLEMGFAHHLLDDLIQLGRLVGFVSRIGDTHACNRGYGFQWFGRRRGFDSARIHATADGSKLFCWMTLDFVSGGSCNTGTRESV